MAIEFDNKNECSPMMHDFYPIVWNNRCVGLMCTRCNKAVHGDDQMSEIYVNDAGMMIEPSGTYFNSLDIHRGSKRRDPRF